MQSSVPIGKAAKKAPPKPSWLKIRPPVGKEYTQLKLLMRELKLSTVCEEAHCPNMGECWGKGTATIMLMGDTCTRGCHFCNVKTGNPKGWLDLEEPQKVAGAIAKLGLTYVVLTSVDRDDLPDGGADHFARTIEELRVRCPETFVEVLIPDFKGDLNSLTRLVAAQPDVIAHNMETVERLTRRVRDGRATYAQSLFVLEKAKEMDPSRYTKSSLMLGLGETENEIIVTLEDLRKVGVDVVTFGQYLQPSTRHLPVEEFVKPEIFLQYKSIAETMGFLYVASGPLVRSSYKAGEMFMEGYLRSRKQAALSVIEPEIKAETCN